MTPWRFDQGRLDYFHFDEIKRIARALVEVDGIPKPRIEDDHIRMALSKYSQRPFLPSTYTVWRNYKRVFGCMLLATEIAGRIVCTDLCKIIASRQDDIDIDDYIGHFANNFYYPSPVFEGYSNIGPQTFPVSAIIKLLISRYLVGKNYISIDDIGRYLIANNVTGLEPITYYATLAPRGIDIDLRQTRELVRFVSQFSFLKWRNPKLFLEVSGNNEALQIEQLLNPRIGTRSPTPGAEIMNLGSNFSSTAFGDLTTAQINVIDTEFTEGSKIRVTHLRTERSAKLKEFYFSTADNPDICDMCAMNTCVQYPWTNRLIELHHLLPLSSPLRVDVKATSVKDIVGLCPSCHRATHKFYSKWLKDNSVQDFRSHDEARNIYAEAKKRIVLI